MAGTESREYVEKRGGESVVMVGEEGAVGKAEQSEMVLSTCIDASHVPQA